MPTWKMKFEHEDTTYGGTGSIVTIAERRAEVLDQGIPDEFLDAILAIGELDVLMGTPNFLARLLIRLCQHERADSDQAIEEYRTWLEKRD